MHPNLGRLLADERMCGVLAEAWVRQEGRNTPPRRYRRTPQRRADGSDRPALWPVLGWLESDYHDRTTGQAPCQPGKFDSLVLLWPPDRAATYRALHKFCAGRCRRLREQAQISTTKLSRNGKFFTTQQARVAPKALYALSTGNQIQPRRRPRAYSLGRHIRVSEISEHPGWRCEGCSPSAPLQR
jgi:hypothetical protein